MAARAQPQPAGRTEGAGGEEAEGRPAAAGVARGGDAIHLTAIQPAPAKINLYLHVGAPGPDGYHPLSSLAVFGGASDRIRAEESAAFAFALEGPFAGALAGEADNLVIRAVRALAGDVMPALRLTLWKAIPVAAGLGGGSSDAAAALRLVRDLAFPKVGDDRLLAILEGLGADGPMCLAARPVIAEGRGERFSPAPRLPTLHGVLVNPGVECPTGAVYRAYDAAGRFGGEARGALADRYDSVADLARDLAACRNDLEAPARALHPAVDACLTHLAAQPECLLARLSGSGATAFVLCADPAAAQSLAARLAWSQPDWWTEPFEIESPQG